MNPAVAPHLIWAVPENDDNNIKAVIMPVSIFFIAICLIEKFPQSYVIFRQQQNKSAFTVVFIAESLQMPIYLYLKNFFRTSKLLLLSNICSFRRLSAYRQQPLLFLMLLSILSRSLLQLASERTIQDQRRSSMKYHISYS